MHVNTHSGIGNREVLLSTIQLEQTFPCLIWTVEHTTLMECSTWLNFVYFDVPDHPEVGAQYLIKGELPLVDPNTLTVTGSLKLFDLTKELGVDTDKLYIIASMVALHWLYGSEVVSKLNQGVNPQNVYDRYVYMCVEKLSTLNLLQYYKQKQYILFMFQGLILMSIADVLAMQPYGQKRLEEKLHSSINAKSKFFPVTNVSKVYRGNDIFVKSMRQVGIQYGNELYTYIVNNIDLIAITIDKKQRS